MGKGRETAIKDKKDIFISFVCPMHNEEGCIEELYGRITALVKAMDCHFEIIAVNDHSTDDTLEKLKALHRQDPRVKILSLSRNFGHQLAVMAGLHRAGGDVVVVMDADLQDPPELVCRMMEKWREGYKVVYGVRRKRKESWVKRVCYASFYRLLQKLSPLPIPLDVGDFSLLDATVVKVLREMNEDRPFIRGLRTWVGFPQVGIAYDRPARHTGDTKYSYARLIRLALDGLLSFSDRILQLSIVTGFIISGLSITYGMYVVLMRILVSTKIIDPIQNVIPGWTTIVAGILFLVGLQFMFIGVIGEYIGRIFMQVKGRPLYVIAESIGFDETP